MTITFRPLPCKKCRGRDIQQRWHANYHRCTGYGRVIGTKFDPECCVEHMHFVCKTCLFEWDGPTLDREAV